MTTVLIAGAGPVGLAAAFELGRRGVACLVVEQRREVSWERPRAKTTSARTMEHLRRWGIAEAVRRRAFLPVAYSDAVVFCTGLVGREITRFSECFALTPEPVELYAEAGQQIPQPLFEQVLRDELASLDSVRLLLGWRLTGLQEGEDSVRAEVVDESGISRQITAQYLIGADGTHGIVRGAIGAHYEGTSDLRPNLNLVFRARGLHALHDHGPAIHYWVLNPRVAGVLGPMDGKDLWWVIATGDAAIEEEPVRVVRELIGAEVDLEVLSTDPWSARMAIASIYGTRRVFLVGDAAHLNPPWGGHGFNTGVGDAVNLGWKLAALAQGWGGPGLLASYEAERRPIAEETVALAAANMRVLAVDLADPLLEAEGESAELARRAAAAEIQRTKSSEFHSLGLVLGYSYGASPVIVSGERPGPAVAGYLPSTRPGARLPHHWLAPGRSLYDELGSGFALVLTRRGAEPGGFEAAAAVRKLPLVILDLSEAEFDDMEGPAVLVRPDQHVVWRGEAGSVDAGAVLDVAAGWTAVTVALPD